MFFFFLLWFSQTCTIFDVKLHDIKDWVKVQKLKRKKEPKMKEGRKQAFCVTLDLKFLFTLCPNTSPSSQPWLLTSDAAADDGAHPCWWSGWRPLVRGPRSHTVREMKLLYLWMFLFRISEHGPSTRSKRGRSSFTHLRGPRATTVAARGRFSSRAISPGCSRGGR